MSDKKPSEYHFPEFSDKLLAWAKANPRPMPWKETKDAYKIWLSEIILQQTRVEQGRPYYLKFIKAYPTIKHLAKAEEDEVLKLWQGLGYYSRARNLHFTAKFISENYKGKFPNRYEEIRALKGVGDYTAAAISSFAYNLPYAVVDGNVYRVLARIFGIETPIDSSKGKKEFQELAQKLLVTDKANNFNQAILDFGATHCKPKNPKCASCPFNDFCVARAKNKIANYPVKSKKLKKRNRYFHYLIFNWREKVYLNKRDDKDIWQGLYDFPLIEVDKLLDIKILKKNIEKKFSLKPSDYQLINKSNPYKQVLSHQNIYATFVEIRILKSLKLNSEQKVFSTQKTTIETYPFPRVVQTYLDDNTLYLPL